MENRKSWYITRLKLGPKSSVDKTSSSQASWPDPSRLSVPPKPPQDPVLFPWVTGWPGLCPSDSGHRAGRPVSCPQAQRRVSGGAGPLPCHCRNQAWGFSRTGALSGVSLESHKTRRPSGISVLFILCRQSAELGYTEARTLEQTAHGYYLNSNPCAARKVCTRLHPRPEDRASFLLPGRRGVRNLQFPIFPKTSTFKRTGTRKVSKKSTKSSSVDR